MTPLRTKMIRDMQLTAACSQDPESLYRRCRRTGQVLSLFPRPTEPRPDPCLLAPYTGRTPPRVEFL